MFYSGDETYSMSLSLDDESNTEGLDEDDEDIFDEDEEELNEDEEVSEE